ncbi:MAG: hypothetical protein HY847_03380 [Betaproteobacteria bacterium]|nr:hypothetical protein [Betaproteobacteria bacterium]
MKRNQKGEVMLVMMAVMLAVVLFGGHEHMMGTMGHGSHAHDQSSSSSDQKGEGSEHQH